MANKVQRQNRIQILPQKLDLNWCLEKLVNGWMRIIGIEPNIPEKKYCWGIFRLLQRWTCFFLSLGVNVYFLVSLHLKNKEKAAKKSSSTENWNVWMDYGFNTIQSISVHLCLLLVISPNWNELRTVMNKAEYHLLNYPRVYPQIRKIVPQIIASFVLMVGILNEIDFRLYKF